MSTIHPVILCGGSGTRLWPRSRKTMPKPFLPLVGEHTLFEATLDRCADPAQFAAPTVVTGAAHLDHVLAQGADHPGLSVIVEPQAQNTAAAIALAACRLPDDAVMLVCPSDHHIADVAAFCGAARAAADLAAGGWMVSFGIAPTAPETGFGYIRRGEELPGGYKVDRFVEKPDYATATAFLADGGYSWNGGIFAFAAGAFMAELDATRPDIAAAVRRSVAEGRAEGPAFYPDAEAFGAFTGDSVDYAVMEKTARAAMVPVSMGWSDIGNWHALRDALPADLDGNRVSGRADLVDCQDVLVQSDGPRVSVIGLAGVAVIVDGDEVLVTTMTGAQLVGKLPGAVNQ
ncbi:MAG: sugar phosphate nucleotidyltransferase [Alteraurantiacibacter sp.]